MKTKLATLLTGLTLGAGGATGVTTLATEPVQYEHTEAQLIDKPTIQHLQRCAVEAGLWDGAPETLNRWRCNAIPQGGRCQATGLREAEPDALPEGVRVVPGQGE